MARYEACTEGAQVLEAGSDGLFLPDVRATGKPWRRLGFGVVVAGAIGAMVYSQLPERRPSPLQRLARFHRKILSAIEEEPDGLGQQQPFDARLNWKLTEEGQVETSAMGVDVRLRPQEGDPGPPEITVVFNSKEGRAMDLVAALEDLKANIFDRERTNEGIQEADDVVEISEDGDTVEVKIKICGLVGGCPPADRRLAEASEGEKPEEASEGEKPEEDSEGEKPEAELTMKISFGRTLQEMWANKDESCATVHGGVSFEAHLALAKRLNKAVDEELETLAHEEGKDATPILNVEHAVASVSSEIALEYRKEVLGMMFPTRIIDLQDALVGAVPFGIGEKLAVLEESIDGLKEVRFIGGDDPKFGLIAKFEHFHITPFLMALLP